MRWLLIFILSLFYLMGCKQDGSNANRSDSDGSAPPIPGNVIEGRNPVEKNSDFHSSGMFIGRPIKTSKRGILWKTWEARVNAGSVQNSFYLGTSMEVSIESEDVYNKFDSLDSDQTYVFRYEQPFWMNPEIEETHYMIRSIEPMQANMAFEAAGVTKASAIEKEGGYSRGDRPGKIVLVRRWGFWDIDCSVELNMGNLGMTTPESALVNPNLQGGGANVENQGISTILGLTNSIVFNVYSEEGCAFAEKALMSGRDVIIKYSEDHIEMWDKYNRVIEEIRLK